MKSTCILGLWITFISSAYLVSCMDRKTQNLVLPREQSELDSLIELFFNEASARGRDVSSWRKSIDVIFGTLPQDRAGSCQPNAYPKVITIDHYYWKISSHQSREQLLFHELAHCLMQRKHVKDTFKFGECRSWMREKDADCLIPLRNKVWRKYYLDELFSKEIVPSPAWYQETAMPIKAKENQKHFSMAVTNSLGPLDSLLGTEQSDWQLTLTVPADDSEGTASYFAITVDNLAFEYSQSNNDRYATTTIISGESNGPLMRRAGNHRNFVYLIQKRGDCAYFFLNDTLRYCLPLANDRVTFYQAGSPPVKSTIDISIFP